MLLSGTSTWWPPASCCAVHPATVHAFTPGLMPLSYPSQRTRLLATLPHTWSSIHFRERTTPGRSRFGVLRSVWSASVRHHAFGLVYGHTVEHVRQICQWLVTSGRSL